MDERPATTSYCVIFGSLGHEFRRVLQEFGKSRLAAGRLVAGAPSGSHGLRQPCCRFPSNSPAVGQLGWRTSSRLIRDSRQTRKHARQQGCRSPEDAKGRARAE